MSFSPLEAFSVTQARSFETLLFKHAFYKLVFKNYLWKLVREGYPVEFFVEGGRSRTGTPPKLGMMSMLLEGIKAGEFKDLQFVPINVSYEGTRNRKLQTRTHGRPKDR